MSGSSDDGGVRLRIGREELILRQRYEVLSIGNDIFIAVWFIAGSILFFFPELTEWGTLFFLLGSIELLIRPVIRLSRRLHLRRVRGLHSASSGDTGQEF
ncbi:YrhK family protein [Salinactinospora qingdaonensis]|uniref:YrhK domain-containing protein n=1 Tax=Salinactinospora qingdaonensis TaxID=702744 RepID=A0ABP7FHI8_9ACTN